MLTFFCIAIILGVAYVMHNEGLFNAVTTLVNVVLAGLVSFEFWEPSADAIEPLFQSSVLGGLEDHIAMVGLFFISLALLRWATNSLSFSDVEIEPNTNRIGGVLVGLLTGYLLAGFLTVSFETLTWHENFMGFTPRTEEESAYRSLLPPDRVWLALMRRASAYSMSSNEVQPDAGNNFERYHTFDAFGTFELRYERYRRYNEKTGKEKRPLVYQGEFDREMKQ